MADYDIRTWGEGFWRWDCRRCRRGVRESFGVLGEPRGYADVVRAAREHVQSRHRTAADPVPAQVA